MSDLGPAEASCELPISAQQRPADNVAAQAASAHTPGGRRETVIDIMASWALDGLRPSPRALEDIEAYVDGRLTVEELIAKAKAEYLRPESEPTEPSS